MNAKRLHLADLNATARQLSDARQWLRGHVSEVDGWTPSQLGSLGVLKGIEEHYEGGWTQFLADQYQTPEQEAEAYAWSAREGEHHVNRGAW